MPRVRWPMKSERKPCSGSVRAKTTGSKKPLGRVLMALAARRDRLMLVSSKHLKLAC